MTADSKPGFWHPESEAPHGEWTIARTVKQPWACKRLNEMPAQEERQAIKIGDDWWFYKNDNGLELIRASFRRTRLFVKIGTSWMRADVGLTTCIPDEWMHIPNGILSQLQISIVKA